MVRRVLRDSIALGPRLGDAQGRGYFVCKQRLHASFTYWFPPLRVRYPAHTNGRYGSL